jgi:hypothetical protein
VLPVTIADQIVIGTERFRGNPANLSFSCKAPEGWRSPKRVAYFGNHRVARSVLDCGGPPPLFRGIISNCANVNRNRYIHESFVFLRKFIRAA